MQVEPLYQLDYLPRGDFEGDVAQSPENIRGGRGEGRGQRVIEGGEAAEAAEVFGGLAEEGGEGSLAALTVNSGEACTEPCRSGVMAFFGEAGAVAFGEVLYSNSSVRHRYTSGSSIAG